MISTRLNRLNLLTAALVLCLATASAAQTEPQAEKLLPNFHQVNEHLYRGAQPLSGGVQRLKALGIKTIINLRRGDEGTGAEEEEARREKLNYFNVPLPGWKRPKDEEVSKILALINDSRNWPVFIHCNHGKDRTGTIISIYRISHDGWTQEQAMKEAERYGMSRFQFWMKDYIKDYYRDHKGKHTAAGASLSSRPQQYGLCTSLIKTQAFQRPKVKEPRTNILSSQVRKGGLPPLSAS